MEKTLETLAPLGSWADITAWAEREYGAEGRAWALLLRGSRAGSKRLIAGYIEDAGYDVGAFLESWGEPYSSMGLSSACRKGAEALEQAIMLAGGPPPGQGWEPQGG